MKKLNVLSYTTIDTFKADFFPFYYKYFIILTISAHIQSSITRLGFQGKIAIVDIGYYVSKMFYISCLHW